jgi:hypothetical protein
MRTKKFERKESTTQSGIKINECTPNYDNIQIDDVSCDIDTHKYNNKRDTTLNIHEVISINESVLHLKDCNTTIIRETIKYKNIDGKICKVQIDKFMKKTE